MSEKDEKSMKLLSGEWIFSEDNRLAYKLDKQGTLIFNCSEDVSEEEKLEFTIEALIDLGMDENKAIEVAAHMGPIQ